ncbi:gamma carbonic anhydrase family protein [Candidatus Marinamargulisbacteria bacterium SCGC AAA071-K20]|nr:gamma carbonic anhydrase family protein [Candidatus Marinamargulisbacteria bacterium SCGC AAA071-K20]
MKKSDLRDTVNLPDPIINKSCFVAHSADILGNVTIGDNSSIWYQVVLRGDINSIVIGERTNIQDGCIVHLENDLACVVGNDVTVGHGAILHGCTIEDGVLIGMGATVLNGAIVKKGAMIGANALVKEGQVVEENALFVGLPAKKVKSIDLSFESNVKWAQKYVKLSKIHKEKYGSKF